MFKTEWNKHIIRSYMTNRNVDATQLYVTLMSTGTSSCARGTFNKVRSQMNKDIQNNMPSLPTIDSNNHMSTTLLQERWLDVQQSLFLHTTKEYIACH